MNNMNSFKIYGKKIDVVVEYLIEEINKIQRKLRKIADLLEEKPFNVKRLSNRYINFCVSSGTLRTEDIFEAIESFLPVSLKIDYLLADEKDIVFEDILDFLDSIAPENCYFGVTEDGSCLGFWEK